MDSAETLLISPVPRAPVDVPPVRARALLLVLGLAGTVFALMQALVIPALPRIQTSLGTNADGAAWISTAYLLSACILTPVIGRLGEMVGKRRMMLASLATFAVGTLVCATAGSLGELVAGRVVQGTAGGIYPLAFAIIRDRLPRERVPAGIGLISSLLGIGGGLGLVLPGPIMARLSYQWLFWLPLVVILATLVLAARYIPADGPAEAGAGIPWGSSLMMALGLSAVLVAVSESATWHWADIRTLGLLLLGAAALLGWGRAEARSSNPLVDMGLMRLRGVWTANAAAMLIGMGMYASFLIIPEFVQSPVRLGYGFGASVTGAGLFMLPTAAVQLLLGPASGLLHRRFSLRAQLIAGQLSCAAGFSSLAVWHAAPWQIYAATTVLGIGFWLCLVALPNQVVSAVPAARTGSATAVNTVVRNAGGAVGGQLAAAIIVGSAQAGSTAPAASGYIGALILCAAATCAGTLVAFAVPRRNPR
ncbi:MFS transporter [Streptacidiphilus sp. N1-12]|uniref:MFS transporter n=2 Tax=Streptacidiphilus alkalitolerans TaxID=3342712 RepID=A0ABV6V5D2_9ACTN